MEIPKEVQDVLDALLKPFKSTSKPEEPQRRFSYKDALKYLKMSEEDYTEFIKWKYDKDNPKEEKGKSTYSKMEKYLYNITSQMEWYDSSSKHKKYRIGDDPWINTLYLHDKLKELVSKKQSLTKKDAIRLVWQLFVVYKKRTR